MKMLRSKLRVATETRGAYLAIYLANLPTQVFPCVLGSNDKNNNTTIEYVASALYCIQLYKIYKS